MARPVLLRKTSHTPPRSKDRPEMEDPAYRGTSSGHERLEMGHSGLTNSGGVIAGLKEGDGAAPEDIACALGPVKPGGEQPTFAVSFVHTL